MKNILLFSVFLLSGISTYAGEVFPKSDAIWNMHQYWNDSFNTEIIYGLIGDTVIDNKTYQKMYLLADTILSFEKAEYVGGFRTEGEQVWFIPGKWVDYQHPEFLLYDFSKKEGDTVYHGWVSSTQAYGPFFRGGEPDREWTSDIWKVYTDEYGRKHIETNGGDWVEGIGGINGFFCTFYTYLTDGSSIHQNLSCFKHQGIVEYNTNQICNKCFCMKLYPDYVDIKNNEENTQVKLSANLQKGIIQIEIPTGLQPAEINLYDLSGVLIHSQLLSEPYSSVDIHAYQPGIYIYRIDRLGKSLQSGKIIIN